VVIILQKNAFFKIWQFFFKMGILQNKIPFNLKFSQFGKNLHKKNVICVMLYYNIQKHYEFFFNVDMV
jgi:hypothetical protein